MSNLVATLPTPFPAPIVIAQHLDPKRPSHLGEILERHTSLPVIIVQDQEPLRANTVYVVPANRHVEISDHDVIVLPDGTGRPVPSVDLLFSSAAKAYGEGLIAVILTGTGSDGTSGARAVKEAGGTVVIQDPRTAAYPGMPLSLEPQTVDVVADIERIGQILNDILTGAGLPEKPDDAEREVGLFLNQLRERLGQDFRSYKTGTIQRRIQRRIVATQTGDLAGYKEYIESHPEEYQHLASSFLIKVTEFMRDPELFNCLRDRVLPELIAYSREHDRELRIWSAGCATGEEAYSLAILVCELLGEELSRFNVKIFATDLDADAVKFARRGSYPTAALDKLPEELVESYFTRVDGDLEARKRVRGLIVFGEHDLVRSAPFPRADLVVCRNVLIYFSKDLQQHALEMFAFALRDGGYLALGKTETVSPIAEYFTPQQGGQKIYRRHGQRRPTPPFHSGSFAPVSTSRTPQRRQQGTALELLRTQQEILKTRSTRESLLHQLRVGVVVVDQHYDIQEINNAARKLLSIHTQGVGEDLLHLAQHVPQRRLRIAIDQAIKQGETVVLKEVPAPHAITGETIYLEISCYPQLSAEDAEVQSACALVLVTDVTETTLSMRALEQAHAKQLAVDVELAQVIADLKSTNATLKTRNEELVQAKRESDDMIARHAERMEHLSEANRELLAANDELTRINGDLRGQQEDFQTANEETQAAVEEVETLNEELQATNEELETLNEELQATIEELNTSNSDLEARGNELQSLSISLEEEKQRSDREREQLEVILVGMGDAVLVVNSEGKQLLSNKAYAQLFGSNDGAEEMVANEKGEPLPADATPQARVARGETFSMTFTLPSLDGTPRWCEAIGKPVSEEGHGRLGVVVIRDITERSLRIMQEEFAAQAGHELRTPLTVVAGNLHILTKGLKNRPDSERLLHNATVALSQSKRLAALITDLVDVSRLQTGKFRLQVESVELDTLLGQVVAMAQDLTEDQTIVLTAQDGPIVVNGDASRLQQVVLNLLTNAITYAPSGKRIDVRLRLAGNMAEIEIQDYGQGIKPEHLDRLFSRFFQVTDGTPNAGHGLGLGLFISRQIVTGHNGTITAKSTVGEGTTFTIHLPLLEQGDHHPTT